MKVIIVGVGTSCARAQLIVQSFKILNIFQF